jgi:hypothetical protein
MPLVGHGQPRRSDPDTKGREDVKENVAPNSTQNRNPASTADICVAASAGADRLAQKREKLSQIAVRALNL